MDSSRLTLTPVSDTHWEHTCWFNSVIRHSLHHLREGHVRQLDSLSLLTLLISFHLYPSPDRGRDTLIHCWYWVQHLTGPLTAFFLLDWLRYWDCCTIRHKYLLWIYLLIAHPHLIAINDNVGWLLIHIKQWAVSEQGTPRSGVFSILEWALSKHGCLHEIATSTSSDRSQCVELLRICQKGVCHLRWLLLVGLRVGDIHLMCSLLDHTRYPDHSLLSRLLWLVVTDK